MTNIPAPVIYLKQEYEQQIILFEHQPPILQRFLESQARQIADGLISKSIQVRFTLPNRVVIRGGQDGQDTIVTIPDAQREQKVGGVWPSLTRCNTHEAILQLLQELEQSPGQAISVSASLLRYASATHMISDLLPSVRSVIYRGDDDDVIPSTPIGDNTPESTITQASDAVEEPGSIEIGRGELQSPFNSSARKFYLPQWVAFDGDRRLLVGSEKEAEAHIQSMQKYVLILHRASALAPYIVACDAYQRKRYGILGQLINQGSALARFKTGEIIHEIKKRAEKGSLNRGLSISMPYFDDQNLDMAETRFDVIPAGCIMFVPAFVVRALNSEQAKVSQDTRLNSSTRKHLLEQLKAVETAFLS
jgi:hypothetical protein